MKRTLLLIVSIYVWTSVQAYDLIMLKNKEKLEVKIEEVSQSEVRFRLNDSSDSTIYNLSLEEVSVILYESGKSQIFSNNTTIKYNTKENNSVPLKINNAQNALMDKDGDWYFLGTTRMTEDQYLDYIEKNCIEAWESYQKGCRLWKRGWWMFGIGNAATIAGAITYYYGILDDKTVSWGSGLGLMIVGGGLSIASIPCVAVGAVKKNGSHRVYNDECVKQYTKNNTTTLDLQANVNGVSLAFKF